MQLVDSHIYSSLLYITRFTRFSSYSLPFPPPNTATTTLKPPSTTTTTTTTTHKPPPSVSLSLYRSLSLNHQHPPKHTYLLPTTKPKTRTHATKNHHVTRV